jgi:hypothetical protein
LLLVICVLLAGVFVYWFTDVRSRPHQQRDSRV